MLGELRNRVISFLSQNRICVIATSGSSGAFSMPAQYENLGLVLNLRLPRWSDACFHIEQDPRVMVIIMGDQSTPLHWLQYRGLARTVDVTDERYATILIKPERIDLIDESRGWGARETLDM